MFLTITYIIARIQDFSQYQYIIDPVAGLQKKPRNRKRF